MTQDPIGLEGGTNKNLYPINPLIRLDPLGLVDLNLFNTGENISGYADKVPLSDTVYKVGAHGNPTMIVDQAGKKITVDELAKKSEKIQNTRKECQLNYSLAIQERPKMDMRKSCQTK